VNINVSKRLSFKLTRNTVISALTLGVVLNLILVTQDYFNAKRDMHSEINALVEISHSPASQIAYNIDTRLAEELLEGLLRHPAIIEARIIDPDHRYLAERKRSLQESPYRWLSDLFFDRHITYQAELQVRQLEDIELGMLEIVVDTHHYGIAFLERAGYTLLSGFIKSLALAILLLFIFYFMLTKPLLKVIDGLAGVDSEKAEKARLPTPPNHREDEIGLLVRITNNHLDTIDHSLQQLRQAEGRLKEYNEKLTQIVETRTGEIRDKNKALQSSNRALIHAKEEALERARARADFLASMSHEIRTPLNGLLGMLSLALDGEIAPGQRNRLEIALNAGHSLLSLVNDILDISKVEAGKLNLEHIPFDLGAIAEECALLFAEQGRKNNLDVIIRLSAGLPGTFRGDPTRTRQIINNLLGNAIKFTTEGKVELVVSQLGDKTRIRVADTGIGMSEQAQSSIFSPFSQGDTDTTRRFGGTGLGLTLCRQLVERMHGHITVDSRENKGTTFTVDLPLDVVSSDNLPMGADSLSGNHVLLLVDPDNVHFRTLQDYLSHWQMPVTPAISDSDAMVRMLEKADVVIVDRQHPAATSLLQQAPETLPIVWLGEMPEARAASQAPNQVIDVPLVRQQIVTTLLINLGLQSPDSVAVASRTEPDQSLNILLVEDNRVNQLVASGMLRKLGHSVDLAENGERALNALEHRRYDLVLMDCQMPVMDGYDATREIRRREGYENLPIIAVTANVMQGDREACIAAGMNDYITKPYTLESLAKTLRHWSPGRR